MWDVISLVCRILSLNIWSDKEVDIIAWECVCRSAMITNEGLCDGKGMDPLFTSAVCIYCVHNDSWKSSVAAILGEGCCLHSSITPVSPSRRKRLTFLTLLTQSQKDQFRSCRSLGSRKSFEVIENSRCLKEFLASGLCREPAEYVWKEQHLEHANMWKRFIFNSL